MQKNGNAIIHKYTLNGYHIVLDTNSGAVHLFGEAPFAMLDYLDGTVSEEPPEAFFHSEYLRIFGL
ncbi:MAG TPA: hypothetical protein DDW99_00135, partial [Ruminococcaceae bacterium]|nr:hypothetical protein [Oscillospiraceae bacterium]